MSVTEEVIAYGNFIDGRFTVPEQSAENVNPADANDVIGLFPESSSADVESAFDAAARAFRTWSRTPTVERGKNLSRMARIIRGRADDFAQAVTREEGMPLAQSQAEVAKAADYFEYYGALGHELGGRTLPSARAGVDIYVEPAPLGVVAAITAWNVPLALPARKIAPALVCGNAIVVKPAEDTPLSCHLIAEAAVEAELPDGVLNVVHGSGQTVGQAVANDLRVRAISFTGSTEVGHTLAKTAAERLIRVQLELGGKNAAIVLDDCSLENAVEQIMLAAYAGSGQQCTATSRVLVQRNILDKFTERLLDRVERLEVGPGTEDGVQVGPLVSERQLNTVLGYVDIGRDEGATLLAGGRRLTGPPYDHGWFMSPTVFGAVENGMRIAQEEIFGPVLAIIGVDDDDEAIEVANDSPYGLSAAVYTTSLPRARRFRTELDVGALAINLPSAGFEVQTPFGGTKASGGTGWKEQGTEGLEFYRELKAVQMLADG